MRRAGIAAASLLLLLTPFAVGALVGWFWLVATEMPGRTWVRRGLFALITVYGVTAGALTVLAVLHKPCEPRVLLAVLLVLALLGQRRLPRRDGAALASPADLWALGFGALTFGVLYAPFVGASTGRTMALISQTTDAGTHFQLVEAIERNRGYVHLIHPTGLSPDVDHYPAGWHGSVWVVSDLLLGGQPSVGASVRLLALVAVAAYALLCGTAAAVVLEVAGRNQRLSTVATLLGLGSLAATTLIGFGLFLLQLASYTHIFALVALLAVVLAAADSAISPQRVLVVLAASSVALLQSWYLLTPLLIAALLAVGLVLRPPLRRLLPLGAATLPLCVYPLLTGPTSTHVDQPGPMLLPTIVGLLGLFLATSAGCAYAIGHLPDPAARALVAATVASLLSLVLLIAKQGFVPGTGVSYYGAKMLLTTLLLGTILAAALVTSTPLRPSPRAGAAALAVLGLALGAYSIGRINLPPRAATYEVQRAAHTLDAVFRDHPDGESAGVETWVLNGCNRVEDLVATKWLYDTSLAWNRPFRDDLNEYVVASKGDVDVLLRRLDARRAKTLELYVHQVCDPQAVARLASNPKVTVIRVP